PWSVQFRKHMNVGIGYLHVGILNAVARGGSECISVLAARAGFSEYRITKDQSAGPAQSDSRLGHCCRPTSRAFRDRAGILQDVFGVYIFLDIRTPTRRIRSPCCAPAASGQAAAAPPSVAKNFRRSMWLAM